MRHDGLIVWAAAVFWLAGHCAAAGRPDGAKYDLARVAGMQHFVGSAEARRLLARNGFVVTDERFKQLFSAYVGDHGSRQLPSYVTTDAVWQAYHVLLEEGVQRLEAVQADRLRAFAGGLLRACLARVAAGETSLQPVAVVLAVGRGLQDGALPKPLPPGVARPAAALLADLDQGASIVNVPVGFPLLASRLRAQGFYADSPHLARYFAARQWFAGVVFRLSNDAETLAAARLAGLVRGDAKLAGLYRQLEEPYTRLLGPAEDGDVDAYAAGVARSGGEVAALRKDLAQHLAMPTVCDQLLGPQQYPRFATVTRGFRLLPPRRVPSAVCFQRTTEPVLPGRAFPTGLDFFAACKTLRSPAAGRALRQAVGEELAVRIARADCGELPDSLHGQALSLLARLQDPPPAGAPGAVRTAAWQDKQLWTQLGAWAEQRHTWALHAKSNAAVFGGTMPSPGYVSPYPAFFEGLARLARATSAALKGAGLRRPRMAQVLAGSLLADTRRARRYAALTARAEDGEPIGEDELTRAWGRYGESVRVLTLLERKLDDRENALFDDTGGTPSIAWRCEALARKALTGDALTKDESSVLTLYGRLAWSTVELIDDFATFCDRLAGIARRQLTAEGITRADVKFLDQIGPKLARFHHYTNQGCLFPKDDVPQASVVYVSPPGNRAEALYAAVARPRALYVVIDRPDPNGPALHLGAVLCTHELRRPLSEPLDDASWRLAVRAGRTPPAPAFTRSFATEIGQDEVVRILEAGGFYPRTGQVPGRKITEALLKLVARGQGRTTKPTWATYVRALTQRCRAEDVPMLLEFLGKNRVKDLEPLVWEIARLDWGPHRRTLTAMLRGEDPNYADAAACILSQRPGDVDFDDLATGFARQGDRTRRLYAYLLGFAGKPTGAVRSCLLAALKDESPGVRYQAARAAGELPPGDDDLAAALIERIDDDNEFVAAEAVWTLRRWNRADAAGAMTRRLEKALRSIDEASAPDRPWVGDGERPKDPQREAVIAGTHYRQGVWGRGGAWHVLTSGLGLPYRLRTLPGALYVALGAFGHRPAMTTLARRAKGPDSQQALAALGRIDPAGQKARLETLLHGRHGIVALQALDELDPAGRTERRVAVALDAQAPPAVRDEALRKLTPSRYGPVTPARKSLARRLAPLLGETREIPGRTLRSRRGERLCETAAVTIGVLLGWRKETDAASDSFHRSEGSPTKGIKSLLHKARAWARTAAKATTEPAREHL